jgi:single-strand DNA-binding protein
MNLNKVTLIGNLVADPVAKKLSSGQAIVRFRLATSFVWKDSKSGKTKQEVEYHSIVAFGSLGKVAAKYLKKGDRVFLDGRLKTSSWQGNDNTRRQRTEVLVTNMIMLGPSKQAGADVVNEEVVIDEVPDEDGGES